jgi:hypothetical protein
LYIGNELYNFSILNTWENLKTLPDLVKAMLKYKNDCIIIGDLLKEKLITSESSKGSTTGSKYQKNTSNTINPERAWVRKNWIDFRDQKYDQNSGPRSRFNSFLPFYFFIFTLFLSFIFIYIIE